MEARVRRIAAELLGVEADELEPEVSLVEDLGADSLDLLEVALRLEAEFGISIAERRLEQLRTYADLVGLVSELVAETTRAERMGVRESTVPISVRTAAIDHRGQPMLHRFLPLTPYEVETIIDDAIGAGRAAAMRVSVPRDVPRSMLSRASQMFSRLRARGVRVAVLREDVIGTGDEEPVGKARRESGDPDALLASVQLVVQTRRLLHEVQKERTLTTFSVASGQPDGAAELAAQATQTDHAVAQLRAFVAVHADHLPVQARLHADEALRLLDALGTTRRQAAGLDISAEGIIAYYSRVDAELLGAVAALIPEAPEPDLVRLAAAHLAFLYAKEDAGIEGAELACAFAAGSFARHQDLTVAALIAAQQSYLTLFTTAAPARILSLYQQRAADPAFEDVARLERIALERASSGPLGVDASVWVGRITAKLERLREVGDIQSGEMLRRAAVAASTGR